MIVVADTTLLNYPVLIGMKICFPASSVVVRRVAPPTAAYKPGVNLFS
jgi:hypothetical protein